MIKYSTSISLVWQIAAAESLVSNHQFIEIEHIFNGLLKISDIQSAEGTKIEIRGFNLEPLERDIKFIEEIFSKAQIDIVLLRRYIRFQVSDKVIRDANEENNIKHRSENCKNYFKQAEKLALKENAYNLECRHILKAILEAPSEVISKALLHFESNANQLLTHLNNTKEMETVIVEGNLEDKEHNTKTPLLNKFGVDLTNLAREGKIEPVIGRRDELLNIIRSLGRITKNNPLLIGEAGVGKSAIVRALALRTTQDKDPILQNKRIIELNMAGIVAGTMYRGDFEDRINKILIETEENEDVILFIDEIHTIIGAGGTLDAANIMKPALASGKIKCIGATTYSEYKKYIEKDAALERRFQIIMVEEPSENETLEILKGLKKRYEEYHQVIIEPEALKSAISLSVRYLPDRKLPDKALDIIDEACCRLKIPSLSLLGSLKDLKSIKDDIVDEEIVAKIVSEWSGRPVERLSKEEQKRLIQMEESLQGRVIGQGNAIVKLSQRIRMAKSGIKNPQKPMGVFLFIGPTGVGKTELAKALAEFLFGSDKDITRIDMSEYMEKHSVSKLIGAPPGYVGYQEGGQLSDKLIKHPYSVVLLDEIEKAHPDVLNLFLQVFDEGRLTDSKGKAIDAKNAIFIMTSNIGSDRYNKEPVGFNAKQNVEIDVISSLKETLSSEFINRIDEVILFNKLEMKDITKIVTVMLDKLKNMLELKGIKLIFSEEIINYLTQNGYNQQFGARFITRTIDNHITKPLSDKIINDDITEDSIITIKIENGNVTFENTEEG